PSRRSTPRTSRSWRCATASPRSPPWSPTARASRCSPRPARFRSPRSRTSSARRRTWTWTRCARRTPRRRRSRTDPPPQQRRAPPPVNGDGALPRLGLSRSATRSRPLDRGAWAAARRRCRSTRRRGRSALGAAGASARGVEAATAIVAARAVVAPEGAVVVTTRPLAAARPVVRADAQLAPADLRAADALHLLRAEGAADLHQGEVGEDLDLPDVLAVQAALAGDGADDARRPRTVRVAHTHLVRGVAALRRGSLARAAIAIAARGAVLAQLRAGELLLLGRGAGALITHG